MELPDNKFDAQTEALEKMAVLSERHRFGDQGQTPLNERAAAGAVEIIELPEGRRPRFLEALQSGPF